MTFSGGGFCGEELNEDRCRQSINCFHRLSDYCNRLLSGGLGVDDSEMKVSYAIPMSLDNPLLDFCCYAKRVPIKFFKKGFYLSDSFRIMG